MTLPWMIEPARALAPSGPISLLSKSVKYGAILRSRVDRERFRDNAAAMAFAPSAPILLNSSRENHGRVRRVSVTRERLCRSTLAMELAPASETSLASMIARD